MLRKTAWIWLAGAIAWMFSGLIGLLRHSIANAELGFFLSVLFLVAWLFYRRQN